MNLATINSHVDTPSSPSIRWFDGYYLQHRPASSFIPASISVVHIFSTFSVGFVGKIGTYAACMPAIGTFASPVRSGPECPSEFAPAWALCPAALLMEAIHG